MVTFLVKNVVFDNRILIITFELSYEQFKQKNIKATLMQTNSNNSTTG